MSAPRILDFQRPAQRGDVGRGIRARACRTALQSPDVKRRALQQAPHPTFIAGSANPTKGHPTDAAFRFVDAVKDAGGTAAAVLALPNGLKEYAIAATGAVARGAGQMRAELTRTWAEVSQADADALADGRYDLAECDRVLAKLQGHRDHTDEAITAWRQYRAALAQSNGRPTPPEAA